jgi:hypothetical protein
MLVYARIINEFLRAEITVDDFCAVYMKSFLSEKNDIADEVFDVLDYMFCEANAYTPDQQLLKESPQDHITETQLRQAARKTLQMLREIEDV